MASYNSTTFGSISGRHGTAVATAGKSGNVLRVFKAPSNPNTARQVNQRTKFGYATTALACMRELAKYTYRNKGGYNYYLSQAMKVAISGEAPDFSVDYSKLKVSEGGVYGSSVTQTKGADRKIAFNWTVSNISAKATGANAKDNLSVVLFNENCQEVLFYDQFAQRIACSTEVEVPAEWTGKVHSWVFFSREDESLSSNSIYVGEQVY